MSIFLVPGFSGGGTGPAGPTGPSGAIAPRRGFPVAIALNQALLDQYPVHWSDGIGPAAGFHTIPDGTPETTNQPHLIPGSVTNDTNGGKDITAHSVAHSGPPVSVHRDEWTVVLTVPSDFDSWSANAIQLATKVVSNGGSVPLTLSLFALNPATGAGFPVGATASRVAAGGAAEVTYTDLTIPSGSMPTLVPGDVLALRYQLDYDNSGGGMSDFSVLFTDLRINWLPA